MYLFFKELLTELFLKKTENQILKTILYQAY